MCWFLVTELINMIYSLFSESHWNQRSRDGHGGAGLEARSHPRGEPHRGWRHTYQPRHPLR